MTIENKYEGMTSEQLLSAMEGMKHEINRVAAELEKRKKNDAKQLTEELAEVIRKVYKMGFSLEIKSAGGRNGQVRLHFANAELASRISDQILTLIVKTK